MELNGSPTRAAVDWPYRMAWIGLICLLLWGMAACTRQLVPATPDYPLPSPPAWVPEPPSTEVRPVKELPVIKNTIQVGAFSTAERAERYAELLQASGLDAYYMIDKDKLYKVRFERFDTHEDARIRAQALQARGVIEEFFIVSPESDVRFTRTGARLRESLVSTALRFIGTPYRWGGASQKDGFDCSGLTMTVFRLNGLELPRSARDQFRAGKVIPWHALEKGDLVFFATGRGRRISHVGIYSGKNQFIHAPRSGKTIRTSSLKNPYYKTRYMGARRYF